MIRGGAEYALGIYITGVDQGSAAECGGLKVSLSVSHAVFISSNKFNICDSLDYTSFFVGEVFFLRLT